MSTTNTDSIIPRPGSPKQIKLERYPISALEQLALLYPDTEIGTDVQIFRHGEDSIMIQEFLTLRFGYWKKFSTEDLSDVFHILESSIIVNDRDDDDCGEQFSYKIPTTSYWKNI
jgi:hypothetical protein